MKDFSEEVKKLIENFKEYGFEYGKPKEYLEFRNGCSITQMEKELIEFKDMKFTEKQFIHEEKRFKTYHVYSSKKGRVYVMTFPGKIRVVTIYPLGRSTVKRYHKAKFK